MDQRRLGRLAALGAMGGAFAVIAIYALIAVVSHSQNRTGGIDDIQQSVTWIATAIPALLIIAVHLVLARQIWGWANGKRYTS